MKILKKTQSICPSCDKVTDAEYIERNGKVYFEKTCPDCGFFSTIAGNEPDKFSDWANHPVINIPPRIALTEGCNTESQSNENCCSEIPNKVRNNDQNTENCCSQNHTDRCCCDEDCNTNNDSNKKSECPLHCGTCSDHLQTACCIIIDLTKRCNQHCPYCFARADDDDYSIHEPSLDELGKKFDFLKYLGEERPFNIQLSGGEPTVRDDLPDIIKLARSKGFEYIQINSNGKRIAEEKEYAKKLKDAGASVVFMQFDGTNDEIYMKTRGEKLLKTKLRAIENCRNARLPVTIVPTIIRDINLDNIGEMLDFLMDNIDVIKGIHFQPVSYFGRCPENKPLTDRLNNSRFKGFSNRPGLTFPERVTMFDIMQEIENQSDLFKYEDFCPINTGHPLCCFYSTYLKESSEKIKCLVSEKTKSLGASCCSQGEMTDHDILAIIKKDRDFVLKKWQMDNIQEIPRTSINEDLAPDENKPMNMDDFLRFYKNNTFTITGMAFMDKSNLDAERTKRCRVQVLTDDNRLVPFCGHTCFE